MFERMADFAGLCNELWKKIALSDCTTTSQAEDTKRWLNPIN